MWCRIVKSGHLVEMAALVAAVILLAPVLWFGLRPVPAVVHPVAGKFTLRATFVSEPGR